MYQQSLRSPFQSVLLYRSLSVEAVIHWRLAVVMAERNITNKELARLTGMQPNSISRLRVRRRLTRIDEDTLSALCKALQCQPGDLMVYEDDKEG